MGVNSLEWVQVRIQKTLETTGIENSFGALLQIGKEIVKIRVEINDMETKKKNTKD